MLRKGKRFLFPVFHHTRTTECRGVSRDVLRRSAERFWHPFIVGRTGADLSSYRFRENLDGLRTPDADFTCQVNGMIGGATLLENFFYVLLCGFDIVDVSFGWKSSMHDPCERYYKGSYVLSHSRPFLGWSPPVASGRGCHVDEPASAGIGTAQAQSMLMSGGGKPTTTPPFPPCPSSSRTQQPSSTGTLVVPFTMHVEGGGSHELLSHIMFRSPALSRISKLNDCPRDVQECLNNPKAVGMIAALRRAYIDPEYITAEALLTASKTADTWADALRVK